MTTQDDSPKPAGEWRWVPAKMTEAMEIAGCTALSTLTADEQMSLNLADGRSQARFKMRRRYDAIIAAAPQKPMTYDRQQAHKSASSALADASLKSVARAMVSEQKPMPDAEGLIKRLREDAARLVDKVGPTDEDLALLITAAQDAADALTAANEQSAWDSHIQIVLEIERDEARERAEKAEQERDDAYAMISRLNAELYEAGIGDGP